MISPPERSPERDAAILAMLPNVAFDGWTKRAITADDADLLFPLGAPEMIEAFCDLTDRRMEEAAANLTETRLSRRVRAVIALRLEQNRPHKEAIRRALAILALPQNARIAAATAARTIDAIWRTAGDESADFSWYTKRAILAAVFGTTILYWLRDTSEDDADTLAFLDRRLAGVGRIGKLRAKAGDLLGRLPRPGKLGTGKLRMGDTG
ncbi:MAG TPA: COQ9 family protein [Acetobacteraceae bacterium]|jgi:ubiquinone biosynthesis protein COQ9|nr:COQ9 family protein [Acetobacteraceae bacterium]